MLNLVVDNMEMSAEDKAFEAEMNHYDRLKDQFGFQTVWSLSSGILEADQKIFQDRPYVVKYKVIAEMGATMDDVTWETFTAVAENGTVMHVPPCRTHLRESSDAESPRNGQASHPHALA